MKSKFLLLTLTTILLVSCGGSNNSVTVSNSSNSMNNSTEEEKFYTINFDLDGGTSKSYVSSKKVKYFSVDDFFFDCVKEGYSFRGWSYNGTKIFDENGNQLENVAMSEEMTFKAIFNQTVKLTIESNIEGAGEVTGSGYYNYNANVDVKVVVNQGYAFVGWFYDDIILSSSNQYKYKMWTDDIVLEARFKLDSYKLEISSNNTDYGYVAINPTSQALNQYKESDKRIFDYTTKVSISAYSTTESVRFLGWYDENNSLVNTSGVYIFIMPNYDFKLEAKWDYFRITYNLNGGVNSASNKDHYSLNNVPTLHNPTKTGYTFKGWKYKGNYITNIESSWLTDITLDAVWKATSYSITYNLNGGTNSTSNPSTYTIEDNITLSSPTKTGYTFKGWYDSENNKVEAISKGTTGNLTLTAEWQPNLNELSITSEDETKGTVQITKGAGYSEEEITVEATPMSNYAFVGFYDNNKLVSTSNPYSFKMPTKNYSLVAKFITKEELGMAPAINVANKTLTYGLYPQTHVSDTTLLSTLNTLTTAESNGWYLYNNAYYAKLTAKPNSSNYTFDDGTKIVSGTTYWFKCEPITWKILESNNGEYKLLSTVLLDAHRYDYSSNNYKYSDIRSWLNNEFYNTAFSLDNSYIQTIEVDNSASTTSSSTNKYACENTNDKVYLLSYQDYLNADYGFSTSTSSSTTRECKTTDYARANRAFSSTNSSYKKNGWYWTRSPSSSYSNYANIVDYDGSLYSDYYVNGTYHGVRPSLSVKIS